VAALGESDKGGIRPAGENGDVETSELTVRKKADGMSMGILD
jgi:hypothetical protein